MPLLFNRCKSAAARENGFTLVELIVTMGIMSLLFAIALPLYLNYQRTAQLAAIRSDVRATVVNVERYLDLKPDADATALNDQTNVRKVNTDKSGKEAITISGTYTNWTVIGQNVSTFGAASSYTYVSQTGKYTSSGSFGGS